MPVKQIPECPFGDKPGNVVISGFDRKLRKHYFQIFHVLRQQLDRGSHIVLKTSGAHDPLAVFTRWEEFSATVSDPHVFVSFAEDELNSESKMFYELGDHADDQIQAASAVRRKVIPIEQHYDDCGNDVSALDLPELSAYATCFDSEDEPSSDEEEYTSNFYASHLWGSDVESTAESLPNFSQVYTTINTWPKGSSTDFVEIFGGAAGMSKVAIRRSLRGGRNYDVVAGCDLRDPHQIRMLFRYLAESKPLVVVMGPPCTPFGPWSEYNKVYNFEGWSRSMEMGLPLVELAAKIALFQYTHNRFFIVENPWLSKLWYLPCWQVILKLAGVFTSYVDQCAYGLVTIDNEPTKKPTAFVANHVALLQYLHGTCTKDHTHTLLAGNSQGVSRCKYAQAWPPMLCVAIVKGIVKLKLLLQYNVAYPVVALEQRCPACKQHMAADDNRHIRQNACRYPSHTPANWLCQACSEHKHSKHSSHTHIVGECRWATVVPRATGVRASSSRGPRVPAHTIAEASEDFNEISPAPPKCLLGEWYKVTDLNTVTELDFVRSTDGWHKCFDMPALVTQNARHIRTTEPRFEAAQFPTRDVYANV